MVPLSNVKIWSVSDVTCCSIPKSCVHFITSYICPLLFILYMYFLENLTLNLTSNFGPCPMSLAAAFRNTTKIVADKVINQSRGAIDDGMWWCYFGDGAMPSKIFVFSYAVY